MTKGSITLAVLSVAQFLLLLLIFFESGWVNQDSKAEGSAILNDSDRHLRESSGGTMNADVRPAVMTESELRRIIQEELRSHIYRIGLNSSQQETPLPVVQKVDDAVMESRRDFVLGQLDYYSSVGSISSAEMAQLQMEIAKLNENGRTEMMSRLNRALNSGVLKGNY